MSNVCTKKYDVTLEAAPKRKVPYWLKPDKMKQTEKGESNVEESRPKKVGIKLIKTLFQISKINNNFIYESPTQ